MNSVLETMQQGDDYVLLHAKLLKSIAPEDKESSKTWWASRP